MCPIVDGTAVSAAVTNPQLLDAVSDDTALGKLTLANTDVASGTSITNIQAELNSNCSYSGKPVNAAYNVTPTWTNNDVGSSTNTLRLRSDLITAKFNASTGHLHTGAAGDAPNIVASTLASVPLKGYIQQGTDLIGKTGTSTDVSTEMSGKTNSTGQTVVGVVVTAPNNKIVIRKATGANQDDVYVDGSGNVVYGRLTFAASVWTLSYFVNLSGTETAYNFSSSSDIRWYYQELYSPMVNPPVYSEFAAIQSDNATADVITATTSLQGKTSLSAAAPGEIANTGAAGTANASVANADHTHKGVHSFAKNGASALYGDVTVSGSANILATQTSQDVSFAITGQIPLTNGGTGLNAVPTNGQLLIGGTTGNTLALATLTGTANQVSVANGQNSITLSTPQDIATASTVQFAAIGINAANSTVKADINGDLALRRTADNTTAGSLNDVSTSGTSFFRFTLATTVTGLANGYTGKILCIVNANSVPLVLSNESASSTAANRIITGTGADMSVASTASVLLRYDDGSSRWRVAGASGSGSGGFSEDANFNLAAGTTALADNTTSQYNVAIGHQAAQHILGSGTTGDNIAIGHLALQGASTFVATNNVAIGANTLKAITTGTSNVAIGASGTVGQAMTTGSDNIIMGRAAAAAMTTGAANICIGVLAGTALTTSGALGSGNVCIGQSTLGAGTTANTSNIAIGSTAMSLFGSGSTRNIALGNAAMKGVAGSTGSENVAIGANCLFAITSGTNNFAAVGSVAPSSAALGALTTGSHNVGIGNNALNANTTGGNNIAFGQLSCATMSTVSDSVGIGRSALELATSTRNVSIGGLSGKTATTANALTTGTDSTFIGFGTGPAVVGAIGFNFMTAIGSGALVATADTVVLGRTSSTTCVGATGINASSTAQTQLTGSLSLLGISTKTTTYTAVISDDALIVDATSAAFTVTLYSAAVSKGKSITFKKKDSSANAVTIATVSSQNIDGATTYSLTGQYNSITLVSDGTQFWVV